MSLNRLVKIVGADVFVEDALKHFGFRALIGLGCRVQDRTFLGSAALGCSSPFCLILGFSLLVGKILLYLQVAEASVGFTMTSVCLDRAGLRPSSIL